MSARSTDAAGGPGERGTPAEVTALLPHRPPFLFVDRIVERDVGPEGGRLVSSWTVAEELDFFRGHYPGRPVTPGVILSEHAFQTGALLVALALRGFSADDGVPVLARVADARFKRMVEPGERVETEVTVEDRVGPAWHLAATVRAAGSLRARLRFVLTATAAAARAAAPAAAGPGPAGNPGGNA